jgi:hypothetical protein
MLRIFEELPSTAGLVGVLEEDGAAVILDMADHAILDQMARHVRPNLDANRFDFNTGVNGQNTLRVTSMLAVSHSAAKIVAHPFVLEVAETILSSYCDNFRLSLSRRL